MTILNRGLVSIVIPAFNSSKTLGRGLNSLLSQDYYNWEAIVVDDGSTDNLESVVTSFKDSRIKYHKLDKNYGRGYARQFGLDRCKGEYIGFLDADDWYLPKKLSTQIEAFKAYKDINIVSCNLRSYSPEGEQLGEIEFQPSTGSIFLQPKASLPIPFASTLIRASLAKKEKFDSSLRETEDFDYLTKILLNEKYILISSALYAYEQDTNNMVKKIINRLDCTKLILRRFKEEYPYAVAKAEFVISLKKLIYRSLDKFNAYHIIKLLKKFTLNHSDSKRVLVTCHSSNFYNRFVEKFVDEYRQNGFDVTTVVYRGMSDINFINTELSINPFATMWRFMCFIFILLFLNPKTLHTNITLGSLIPLVSGLICRVPRRIYHNHGFGFLGHRGLVRFALKIVEKINCSLATEVITVSRSNLLLAVKENVVDNKKIQVLGSGSAIGVEKRKTLIRGLIPSRNIGYVGRPHFRKGFYDLLKFWSEAGLDKKGYTLHIAGCNEMDVDRFGFKGINSVKCHGYIRDMEQFYNSISILLLPSYHEGFGQCIIEAAQFGVPSIASDIPGITCAVEHEKTGLLHKPGDIKKIIEYTNLLLENNDYRNKLGEAARQKAENEFSRNKILEEFKNNFLKAS